ncbi:hypothetical protein B0J11DRAFT_511865 [Dendryphion nanum]|uniref:SnoaL-like domain-containing protein n=1 Tax=Dendryphion nanum TaxID=256645 RepID=A0A9P9D3S7_9PLEO|nr:hypothetical protein B0J11DRAFT_511865 [Dendryphion nanum]
MALSIRSRDDFNHYINAFNNNDTPVYSAYYASDCEMCLGPLALNGIDAIKQFFAVGRTQISEHVDPELVLMDGNLLAITATITFTAKVELKEGFADIGPPVPQGGGYITVFAIFYELNDRGQFKKVYAGRVKPAKVFKAGKL